MEFGRIKSMLAELGSEKDLRRDDLLFEPKLDGTRTIAYINTKKKSVKLMNRRNVNISYRYLELQDIWKNIKANFAILDGEIIVIDPKTGNPDFYKLAEREHIDDKVRIKILSEQMPATYFVFDILNLNGKDLTKLPLMKRKKVLEKTIKDSERVKKCYYTENGLELWKSIKKMELEGVMAKDKDSVYLNKRSNSWLKIKRLKTLDCLICGYTEGTGWRKKYFGALLCGVYHKNKLIYIGRVGTGLDEEGYKKLTEELKKLETRKNPFDEFEEEPNILKKIHFVKPKLIAEVRFMNISKNLKMRAPSFLRLRKDKRKEECILERVQNIL